MFSVGIDIGGTFTDIVLLDDVGGKMFVGKVLTTPEDPSVGAISGLSDILGKSGIVGEGLGRVLHGTTLIVNTIIERKGARTGLITTRGFRDTLGIGREKRYDIYDIFIETPRPLVKRRHIGEVTERLLNDGTILVPMDVNEARRVVNGLLEAGVESVAICLLHSFRDPIHERQIAAIAEEMAPAVCVSLSADVLPEIGEYERTSTTVANAYTQPVAKRYLGQLKKGLSDIGYRRGLFIMLSGGGVTGSDVAERFPVRIVESGPAAGAIAASYYARSYGLPRVLSFDMGGTTAKACLIEGGTPLKTNDYEVARVHRLKKGSGIPIRLPVIDLIEVGAGGGSIARIGEMGLMKVGPESAGADPGPVCYGGGGTSPTVTDADVVLGYLNPDYFLGGRMKLDLEGARRAIHDGLASPLGMDVVEAAWGIHRVVDENMANAARVHAIERGQNLREFVMIPFGGAGPVHAHRVASRLGINRIICPLAPGVTSALGFLLTPVAFDLGRGYMVPLRDVALAEVNRLYSEMEREASSFLIDAGVGEEEIFIARSCEMRYVGQAHHIEVPVPAGTLGADSLAQLRSAYDREYLRHFKRLNPGMEIEAINWRLVASGGQPLVDLRRLSAGLKREGSRLSPGRRPVYFPEKGGFVECPIYDRYGLSPGWEEWGPAVIEEAESTLVVGPGARVWCDENYCLNVEELGKG